MKNLSLLLSLFFSFFAVTTSFGQDSLQVKYDKLINETETFQKYKVIPKTELDAFWSETVDSLSETKGVIKGLRLNVASQEDSIRSLKSKLSSVQTSLDESLAVNDSISFMGVPFTKLAYHIMVWVIIIVLAIFAAVAYMMFLRSNKQTTKFKRELESLSTELENHKDKSRDQQMKLKRELQTAVNQLGERRN